jgi:hypothetical protein
MILFQVQFDEPRLLQVLFTCIRVHDEVSIQVKEVQALEECLNALNALWHAMGPLEFQPLLTVVEWFSNL